MDACKVDGSGFDCYLAFDTTGPTLFITWAEPWTATSDVFLSLPSCLSGPDDHVLSSHDIPEHHDSGSRLQNGVAHPGFQAVRFLSMKIPGSCFE